MRMRAALAIVTLAGLTTIAACSPSESSDDKKPEEKAAQSADKSDDADKKGEGKKKPLKSKTVSSEERLDALSRAVVWHEPPPISRAYLGADPKQPQEITCTF